MVERLHVLVYGETIGHLERGSAFEDPTFTYDSNYVTRRSVPLSAYLPIRNETNKATRVAPYLLGLLPECLDARSAWAGRLGTTPEDAFKMLSQMGWECPGAVQFCKPEDLPTLTQRSDVQASAPGASGSG